VKRFTLICALILTAFVTGSVSGQEITTKLTRIQCPDGVETYVCKAMYFDISPPLSEMAKASNALVKKKKFRENENPMNPKYLTFGYHPFLLPEDPVWQKQNGTYMPQTNGPIVDFEGTGNIDNVMPPDTQGDVSTDRYIQVINSRLTIWNKTGGLVQAQMPLSTIWNGIPAPYNGRNDGDPVVLWDQAAGRWMISQFSLPSASQNAELVAISATSDPTGTWYRYVFMFGNQMPDYPKLGVWPDGYYLAFNQFANQSSYSGTGACALQRDKMLTGDPSAAMVYKTQGTSAANPWAMLPADWDGTSAPPSGASNFFIYFDDWSSTTTQYLKVWSFHVDWATTSNSTFAQTDQMTTAAFNSTLCTDATGRGRCVPEPGGSTTAYKLDDLADRLMFRNQYRNFGGYQTMVDCHTVNVSGGQAGCRWYEMRNTGSGWSIYQQGTYAPDANHRWVPSVSMNGNGDIALAYSISNNSNIYPSIRYTGRRSNDALGVMTVAEQTIIDGTGSQNYANDGRWGDYSCMSVDPSDDQTFWFTSEYVQTTGGWTWQTRIASFKFSNQPIVVTTAATGITGIGATLNGTINPNGLSSTYHFEWGTTTAYGNNTSTNSAGSGSSAVAESAPISGLIGGTTYHFRIDGTNSDGTSNGNDMTFTPGAATLTTTAATNITMTTATSGGNVLGDGGSTVTARGVCWGTSANPTISGSHSTDGAGTGTFVSSLTGLTANTTYHIRAYATNSFGTWYGNDLQFTTLCSYYSLPFTESFSATTIPSCWSQVDHQSNGEVWLFGVITGYTGLPALTGNYAYLCSRCYGTGQTQNADLVTPVLDCSANNNVTLAFNHYFRQGGGGSATLSYSIDGGTTWTTIQSWTTSTANPAAFSQVIAGVANQSQVKFRWNYTGTYGYWWAVDDISVTGTTTNTLAVTPPNQNVPATPAGSTNFTVTSNTSWNASSNQGWCTVTPSGTGNGTITANYTINTSASQRVATITVTASGATTVTVTVTQAGATPTLSVTPSNQNVPATPAGTTNFTVTSNADWTAASNQTWCTVTASGTGNGTIVASYAVNPTTVSRIANITVTVATLTPVVVTVTQAAGAPTLTVVPPNQNVPNTPAGSTTFTVTSNTSWTTSSNAGWCTVTPGSSSGDGVITANYTENTDTISRTATITVTASGLSPVTVTVTQAAAPHTLSVVPSNQNVPASPAGSTQFNVTSNSNWTVVSDQTWCTVNSSGSANGLITANYSVNTSSSSRIANITVTVNGISPVVVTVTQNGTSPTLSVTPPNQNVGYLPGTTNFTVLSNSSWTASSDSAWLTVTSAGTGNGTINANFIQNPYYITRVATVTVTVAGLTPQTVTVTQAQSTVSVREHSSDVIRIIPNPSKGSFRIDVGEMKYTTFIVTIMDISGRIIMLKDCRDHADLLFNLSNSPEGSYFIRINADNQEITEKLILAR